MRAKIRWTLGVGLLIVMLAALPGSAANSFQLVPTDHWSYDALVELSETPLLTTTEAAFAADIQVTRYEVALLVARVLENLMRLGGEDEAVEDEHLEDVFERAAGSELGGQLTEHHLRLIRRLVKTFRSELADLGVIVEDADPPGGVLTRDDADLNEFVSDGAVVIRVGTTIHSSEQWTIDTKVIRKLQEGEANKAVASVVGSMKLNDSLELRGEYSGNPDDDARVKDAIVIGAEMSMGEGIKLGADFSTVQAGFDPVIDKDSATGSVDRKRQGYNVYLQYGDWLLRTERLYLSPLEEGIQAADAITAWDLQYRSSGDASVRASYKVVNLASLKEETSEPEKTAEFGLDFPVDGNSTIRIGLGYDAGEDINPLSPEALQAGVRYQFPGDDKATLHADLSLEGEGEKRKATTSLTFDYEVEQSTALRLGYRLIDFGNVEDEELEEANVATAEFTIKF